MFPGFTIGFCFVTRPAESSRRNTFNLSDSSSGPLACGCLSAKWKHSSSTECPTSSAGCPFKLPPEEPVPTVGRSPSGRCRLSGASCQDNSWPRGKRELRSSSLLQFWGGQPHQSRDVQRPPSAEERPLLLKLPALLFL